ncbi:O-antigen ligase family protein [Fulvivirga sediminis]|uniref:O-antigen ligase family protein n=1 Tax=Fulvivirga sediminis TaxID=2803949 RepID=A0A937JZV3_9BACT|nr:O-antigen ligase family protein [Fulvivirga sediminis]MBL3654837.1 O-antigen ligase family protein [Fulvivirga sediminis]
MKISALNLSSILIILSALINPTLLVTKTDLLIPVILIEIFVLILLLRKLELMSYVVFFFSFQFYGVSFLGIKIYDLTFLALIIYETFRGKGIRFVKPNKFPIALFFCLILVAYSFLLIIVSKFNAATISESFIESSRYLFCFCVFYYFINCRIIDYKKFFFSFLFLCISNLLQGVLVYFLFKELVIFDSYANTLYDISLFSPLEEARMAGFFSDPNKYYLFFTAVLFFYECVAYKEKRLGLKRSKYGYLLIVLCLLGLGSSLSRIALLLIILYVSYKFVFRFLSKRWYPIIGWATSVSLILFFITLPLLINYYDSFVSLFTSAIGRGESLKYSASLSNDSRINAWVLAIEEIANHPIMGYGAYYWQSFYYMPPHNTFLSILMDFGLIGAFLFIGVFYPIFKHWNNYYVLVFFLIPLLILDLQTFRLCFIMLAFYINESKSISNESLNSWSCTI